MQGIKAKLFDKEMLASSYIPYTFFLDSKTLVTQNYDLIGFISLDGTNFATLDQGVEEQQYNLLYQAIANLDPNIGIWVSRIRNKLGPRDLDNNIMKHWSVSREKLHSNLGAKFRQAFLEGYSSNDLFQDKFYIALVYKSNVNLLKSKRQAVHLKEGVVKDKLRSSLVSNSKELHAVMMQLQDAMSGFKAKVLDIACNLEILQYLGFLLNFKQCKYNLPIADLKYVLPKERLSFGFDSMQFGLEVGSRKIVDTTTMTSKVKFAAILSIRSYGEQTSPNMLCAITKLPIECVITSSFKPLSKAASLKQIKLHRARLIQVQDEAISQVNALDMALDELQSQNLSFGKFHYTILVAADTQETLEQHISNLKTLVLEQGFTPVQEDLNLESAFWAQLPGNFSEIKRVALISSKNFVDLLNLDMPHKGYFNNNHLQGALMPVVTDTLSHYNFNLHLTGKKDSRSLGHTSLIAPTGAGKTTLMLTIDLFSQQYDGKRFFFDRNRAISAYVKANDGAYIDFKPGVATQINPFAVVDTAQNRKFLIDFMASLIGKVITDLTSRDLNEINRAIDGAFFLTADKRTLSNLLPYFSVDWSHLESLYEWTHLKGGNYAYLFDNREDCFNLDKEIIGFDLTDILNDTKAIQPLLLVLFNRVEQTLKGQLTGIYLDEGWQFLNHPIWESKLAEWLVTLRKQNAYVFFSTQDPGQIIKSKLAYGLKESIATQIFMPNPNADLELYTKHFSLNPKEAQLIKSLIPSTRKFLVKQAGYSQVLKLDLTGLEGYLPLFSPTIEDLELIDSLQQKYGDMANKWLPYFFDKNACNQNPKSGLDGD